jgi:ferredoxin
MQCQDAPCIKAAKNEAVYKRPEEKKLPQKGTFCVHRLEEGGIPRCAQACPTGALTFGDLGDPKSEASKLLKSSKAEVFHPEWNTCPSVYYIDLYKITKSFISGTVIFGDTDECADGVKATLTVDGKSFKTTTNNYGKYKLNLEFTGYNPKAVSVDLKTDKYLGDIFLAKA